jgi:hypothetical protein
MTEGRFSQQAVESLAVPQSATMNLLWNPSVETATGFGGAVSGGIGPLGAGVAIARDTDTPYLGIYSVRIVTPGTGALEGVRFYTGIGLGWTGSKHTYIASAYVRGAGAVHLELVVVYDAGASYTAVTTPLTATGTWTRYVTPTITSDPIKKIHYIGASVRTSVTSAVTFYVDAAQVEENIVATDYIDGTQPGCTWTGIAHTSPSIRAGAGIAPSLQTSQQVAEVLAIPNVSQVQLSQQVLEVLTVIPQVTGRSFGQVIG